MNATTHTEIYRPFTGTLAPARPAFWPLYRSRVRQNLKRKLPLLLTLVPPWISARIFSFVVYTKFTVEQGGDSPLTGSPLGAFAGAAIGQMLAVHKQIITFATVSSLFALVMIAWYGAGQICEDRRAGAHLLYFSRPLTRLDYFLAHFATAFTFGAFAVILPILLICTVAVFSSPEYSFLIEKWDVVLGALGYSVINVAVMSLIVLAISSVSSRKTYALAGVFGFVLGLDALGGVLWQLQRDKNFAIIGVMRNFRRLIEWMLSDNDPRFDWNPWWSAAVLGGIALAAAIVIASRLKRMEVVA